MKAILKNRNVWIVAGIVVLAGMLLVWGGGGRTGLSGVPVVEEPEASAYVLVTTGEGSTLYPVQEETYSVTVQQPQSDGSVQENEITISPEGVHMSHANCDNQDCVGQGTVTLENREYRILSNMIICLPHRVQVELYTAEEIASLQQRKANEE